MATENLNELITRKARQSLAPWGPNYLEGASPTFYWQPETLCYSSVDTGREVWVVVRGRDDQGDTYSPEYASEGISYDGSMLGFYSYRYYPTSATERRQTNNISGTTSQIIRWVVRLDGSKLRYTRGMGDSRKGDIGFGWANTENAYYCTGDGTHGGAVYELTKNVVDPSTLLVTSSVILNTSSASGGDVSKGLSNLVKTAAKRAISNDDGYMVLHTGNPDNFSRDIPTMGYMRIALNQGVSPTILQYWGLSRGLHEYTLHKDPTTSYSAWSGATTYSLGQRVTYSGLFYQSRVNSNLNHIPPTSTTYWTLLDPGSPTAWSSSTNYFSKGMVVTYLGSHYISIATGTNHLPTDINYWAPLTGGYMETAIHAGANVHLGATLDRMWVQHGTIVSGDVFWLFSMSGSDADGGPVWQNWNGSSYGANEIIPMATGDGYGTDPEGFHHPYPGHPTPDRWGQYFLWGNSDSPNSGTTVSLINSPGTGFDGSTGVITNDIATGFNPDGHHHAWNSWSDFVVFFPSNINGVSNVPVGESPSIMYTRKVDVVNGLLGNPIQLCNPQTGNATNYTALARPIQSPDGTKVFFSSWFLNTNDSSPYIAYVVAQYPYPPNISGVTKSGANVRLTFAPTPYTNRKSNGDGTGSTISPKEIKGWHVWTSDNGTNGWTELTTTAEAFANTTYDIAQSNGTTKYYAITAEENSGLESRSLSNIWRAVLDGGGVLTATQTQAYPSDPGAASAFWSTAPAVITGFSVTPQISAYHKALAWTEPAGSKIRYYNIYYSTLANPIADQTKKIASVPVGTSAYYDWCADPEASNHYYGIGTVDRQGNESALVFASDITVTPTVFINLITVTPSPIRTLNVEFSSLGITGNVTCELSRDGGTTYTLLDTQAYTVGVFHEQVGNNVGARCKVRLASVDFPAATTISDLFSLGERYKTTIGRQLKGAII